MKTLKYVFSMFIVLLFCSFDFCISQIVKEAKGLDKLAGSRQETATDWSVEMSNWIINKTPALQQPWDYTVGLVMEGILRVYKRTNDQRYLDYVRSWAQKHISSDGTIDVPLSSLDNMMPGFTILHLFNETHDDRLKKAATKIRNTLVSFPRTTDRGFWHALDIPNELWLDGLYMGMPFLVTYGKMFNEEQITFDEAILQFRVHISHLKDNSTGLLLHAYDEDGSASWAVPPLNRSPYAWGRAIGWVTMGLTEILDIIPDGYKDRNLLVEEYVSLLKTLSRYQNVSTGLWYQIVDHPNDSRNWLETSCSMMYIFSMSRAIENGYLEGSYTPVVEKGYAGVLSRISEDAAKNVFLRDICSGTGVSSDINYYFNRERKTNDNHGLGIFLIMNEFLAYHNLPWIFINTSARVIAEPGQTVLLYPNPCTDFTVLEMKGSGDNIAGLYNTEGSLVKTISVQQGKTRIDVSGLPRGLYFLKIRSEGKLIVKKFLRQ